jgi:glycosyltransferase involved in cell wall biosynthesis
MTAKECTASVQTSDSWDTSSCRILTTYPKHDHRMWISRVELLPGWREEVARTWGAPGGRSVRDDLKWAWRLFRASRSYDVVVSGSDRMTRIFAVLQLVLRRKRVPLLYIDWLGKVTGSPIERWFRRAGLRLALLGPSRALVQGRDEIPAWASELRLPASKFVFVPYHSTLYEFSCQAEEGDYVFAGGDTRRDYPTLVEAARGLPYRIVIAALRRDHFQGIEIPENVEIVTVRQDDFFRLMAGAALVVVPMLGGMIHPGGEQTWINAMTLGKPVIVAEDRSAKDYIEHGITGYLVEPGNPAELARVIRLLMEDRALARLVGQKAALAARRFTPEIFIESVLRLAEECVRNARQGNG